MTLVSIPWQPSYKLTPDTLALLVSASKAHGSNLIVTDAWRSYAEQSYYYDQYINHGGNIAANPDTGQRNHMRGAAFDLADTSSAVQADCRSVGLIRDPDESWHWNNPNAANMPIIIADTIAAVLGPIVVIPPLTKDEANMLKFWRTVSKRQYWGSYLFSGKDAAAKYVIAQRYAASTTVYDQATINSTEEQWLLEMLAANGIKK